MTLSKYFDDGKSQILKSKKTYNFCCDFIKVLVSLPHVFVRSWFKNLKRGKNNIRDGKKDVDGGGAAAYCGGVCGWHWQEVAKGFSQSRDVSPILSPLFYPKLSFAHSSNRRLYFVEKKALLPDDKEWERNRCCLHHYTIQPASPLHNTHWSGIENSNLSNLKEKLSFFLVQNCSVGAVI